MDEWRVESRGASVVWTTFPPHHYPCQTASRRHRTLRGSSSFLLLLSRGSLRSARVVHNIATPWLGGCNILYNRRLCGSGAGGERLYEGEGHEVFIQDCLEVVLDIWNHWDEVELEMVEYLLFEEGAVGVVYLNFHCPACTDE